MTDSIILRQQRDARCGGTGNDSHRIGRCAPRDMTPQWDYIAPTAKMEYKGLSVGCLQTIVDEMNQQAVENFKNNYRSPTPYVLLPLLVLGVIVYFFPFRWWLCFMCAILSVVGCIRINLKQMERAKEVVFENLRQKVDQQLNPHWNRLNILWVIKMETVTYQGEESSSDVTYFNVVITLMQDQIHHNEKLVQVGQVLATANQQQGQSMNSVYAFTTIEAVMINEPMRVL